MPCVFFRANKLSLSLTVEIKRSVSRQMFRGGCSFSPFRCRAVERWSLVVRCSSVLWHDESISALRDYRHSAGGSRWRRVLSNGLLDAGGGQTCSSWKSPGLRHRMPRAANPIRCSSAWSSLVPSSRRPSRLDRTGLSHRVGGVNWTSQYSRLSLKDNLKSEHV